MQRNFTSKIAGLSDFSYHDRLRILNITSLQRRRERFIIISVWKIINNVSPNDLNFQITVNDRRGLKVKVPPLRNHSTRKSRSLYEQSFGVMGPRLWNTLPPHVSTITNKCTFKTSLSKYLTTIPDRPPVCGTTSHNSLLDINRLQLINSGGRAPNVAAAADSAAVAPTGVHDGPHQT